MPLPPTKRERDVCWNATKAYFECLDSNGMWLDGVIPQTEQEILELGGTPSTASGGENMAAFHFTTERIKQKQKSYLVEKIQREEEARANSDDRFWEKVKAKS
ncbi:hypothetical protein HDU91_001229 [Kappamyces sp. JEL0680]|nr:hypothetical protein HDU91_001229 [Kappamyces sp. JEL0680]